MHTELAVHTASETWDNSSNSFKAGRVETMRATTAASANPVHVDKVQGVSYHADKVPIKGTNVRATL